MTNPIEFKAILHVRYNTRGNPNYWVTIPVKEATKLKENQQIEAGDQITLVIQ